ncbi:unnamed protein product [Mucor circinelloides]|uniref:Uncharacterized protein n=1 Tax=Mucor circinelloides f. circinelloides (strain 1006PhL) TaxID=1220926 RepID=S2JCJ1_MUCC1|nr:hypothetical protein HMPREF1544_07059 [Mucor circinelloides 1006PhL]KAG1111908.1 hypothetical protein G6F42_014894 [Rhizopus arrhizus]
MASNNPLNMLSNVSECSISGLFQELVNKSMKSPTTHSEPLKLGDSEGSDFKRLLHKKNHNGSNNKIQITNSPTIDVITARNRQDDDFVRSKKKTFHHGSPDFRPVVYLEQKPTRASNRFGNAIYNFFFQHEDRYFNHDRDELSKDIFPVGYEQRA